MRITRR